MIRWLARCFARTEEFEWSESVWRVFCTVNVVVSIKRKLSTSHLGVIETILCV